jgi:hypothetical protein
MRTSNPASFTVPWLSDLPQLPARYGPDGRQWGNSIAVCVVMKDENVTDVREWLTYYRCVHACHTARCNRRAIPQDSISMQHSSVLCRTAVASFHRLRPLPALAYAMSAG